MKRIIEWFKRLFTKRRPIVITDDPKITIDGYAYIFVAIEKLSTIEPSKELSLGYEKITIVADKRGIKKIINFKNKRKEVEVKFLLGEETTIEHKAIIEEIQICNDFCIVEAEIVTKPTIK